MDTVLHMKGIKKYFGPVKANDDIDIEIYKGEIHALLGENGAGKTTLMNILYGLYAQDEGEIIVRGENVDISNPKDALNLGIGMVHQHFMLVPPFTVAENISIGLKGQNPLKADLSVIAEKVKTLSRKFGLEVDPNSIVAHLSVGAQQRVEIIKILYRDANILILDEPTAVLTPQEAKELFKVLRNFAKIGGTVILISHKLKEILQISDRVTVLRNGKKVALVDTKTTNERKLAKLMIGKEVLLKYEKPLLKTGEIALQLDDVSCKNMKGVEKVKNLSLMVHRGEILGVAGVDGNGQKELAEAISGLRNIESGQIILGSEDVSDTSAYQRICSGLGYVPDDRIGTGLITAFSIAYNLVLKSFPRQPFTKHGLIQHNEIFKNAKSIVREYSIKTHSEKNLVQNLSGGNQQKVLLAREISEKPKLLLISQPTRGLDVGAMEFIHRTLLEERLRGMGILLISSDLDEVLELSDRVIVLYEGKIVGEFIPGTITIEEIGLLMAGVSRKIIN